MRNMRRLKMKRHWLCHVGIMVVIVVSLGWLGRKDYSMAKDAQDGVDSRLVTANTRFGFKLFTKLVEQERGKNIFASPTSVAMALAMTYNGAAGDTKEGMAKTLELQGMSLSEL